MAESYDVIIVGAGNGGLIAACTLSQMGFRTLLLEKHNLPGGCAASFVRGRFEFEASLHNLPYVGPGAENGDIGMLFKRFGVERNFYPIPESLHFFVDGPEPFAFKAGVGREAFARAVEAVCPGAAEAFERFTAMCDDLNRGLAALSAARGKPDPAAMAREHPNYYRLASSTVDEMFEALELPERLRDILSVFALYQCGDTSKIDAARFMLMTDSFITEGASQTDLRSFGLSTALANSARRFGCDIWYNCDVSKICTDGGAVSGVQLSDGRKISAKRVVCNIMPHLVYGRLLDPAAAPVMELKKANARTLGARAFCVFLGLDRDWRELGFKDYATFINSSVKNAENIRNGGSRESNGDLSVNVLNAVVPDASPAGTCIVYLTAMFNADAFADVTPDNYTKIKEAYAEKLIARTERVLGVDLRDHIEEIVISTPVTYARYLGTPQGAVFGYSPEDWDGMMSRNMGEQAEKTIPGLYFAGGHGARLSGFSPSYMSGFLTAMRVADEMRGGAGA